MSRVNSASPPVSASTRDDRLRKLSTSASRDAVGPRARHRSTSASWEMCSGTSSTCRRSPRFFSIASSTRRDFPDPARPTHTDSIRPASFLTH